MLGRGRCPLPRPYPQICYNWWVKTEKYNSQAPAGSGHDQLVHEWLRSFSNPDRSRFVRWDRSSPECADLRSCKIKVINFVSLICWAPDPTPKFVTNSGLDLIENREHFARIDQINLDPKKNATIIQWVGNVNKLRLPSVCECRRNYVKMCKKRQNCAKTIGRLQRVIVWLTLTA